MTTRDERVGRALDVLVYAPLGLGLWLRDLTPSLVDTLVSRGRAEVDRRHEQAQQHVTTARSMGEVALAFGVPKLRARAEREVKAQVDAVRQHADRLVGNLGGGGRTNGAGASTASPSAAAATTPPPRHAPAADAPAVVDDTATPAEPRSASSAHLPIPGYDALSASQVVERLAGLAEDDLHAVREYETSNRNRRTILGKIDQLTS
jgi:hypothetical protein